MLGTFNIQQGECLKVQISVANLVSLAPLCLGTFFLYVPMFSLSKEMLQGVSLLMHYDSSKKLVLECNASPYGLGAVLSHVMEDGRPVGYVSRTLSQSEMN